MIVNGDLLWRRTEATTGANHYGVAVWMPNGLYVIHRQRNNYGVVETLDDFLMGFRLRGSERTPISHSSTKSLIYKFDNWFAGEFDILRNNCEQYAYRFATVYNHSPDTSRRTLFAISLIITLVIYFFYNQNPLK